MPSLYEATAATGDVSSSDFTTLYNASGLTVPNAGAGAVTGNLNVSGNLTVQGTSNLIGAVTIGNTLSTPNYTFPLPDGSTDQVLVTDGNGNLYWTDVTAIPGAAYQIEATTTTGGANLTLLDSAGGTDSVKFASGTNITVSRTNANTITISSSADDIPDGTADGQVLVWESGAWTANNIVESSASTGRFTASFKNGNAGLISAMRVLRNYGSIPYATGYGTATSYQVSSNSQSANTIGAVGFGYDAVNPIFSVATSIDNFTTRKYIVEIDDTNVQFNGTNLVLNFNHTGTPTQNATITVERGSSTDATITWDETTTQRWILSNGLTVNGNTSVGGTIDATGVISTTAESININSDSTNTDSYLNFKGLTKYLKWSDTNNRFEFSDSIYVPGSISATGVITTTAETISMNSDSTAADSQLNFKGTTQYLKWNNTTNQFELSNGISIGGNATVLGNYSQTGETMTINSDNTAADSFLYMKGSSEYLKWDNTNTRFEFSDQLYISQAEPPAIFERQVTSADVNPSELKAALRLYERVTDAVSNATDNGGPTITFGRTSGTSGGAEQLFASMGSAWYGTTNKAGLQFNWSPNNFPEQSPGLFPTSYTLLDLRSDYAQFFNNSVYIDYAYVDSTKTATSITGGNTLVFGSAHGYSANDRILYQTASQNGLIQSTYYYVRATGLTATQCQVSLTSGGSAVALTNGTGLTLTFARVSNRVGINTNSPAYTLDVNGDARVTGNVITGGITAGNITVGVVTDNTISTTSGVLDIVPATGSDMTLTTVTAANPVTLARTTANTNTPTRAARFQLASTGTPAVGIGTRLEFSTQTGASTFVSGAYIETESTNIGSGTEAFDMNIQLMNAGALGTKATLTSVGNFSIVGDLTVNGNDIKSSTLTALTLSGADVTVQGDLTVNGNDIKSSTATALTLSGADVDVQGDLTVTGNDIKSSGGTTAITMNGADVAIAGNLGVDITATNVTVQLGSQVSMITAQTVTTSTATVALTTSTRSSMNGSVTIKDNVTSALHTVNFTVLRDGATALLTTYGELYTAAALANFTADVSGSVIRLLATPVSANNTTFNAVRTAIS